MTESSKPKVVIVGICQSGNLSLATALLLMRYHSMGYHRAALQPCLNGDMRYLDNFVEEFDSLRDYPFNIFFEHIADKQPDCKFILNYRGDLNRWFDKLRDYSQTDLRHSAVHRFWWGKGLLEECDRQHCIRVHEEHCERARRVLAGRLLEFCIDDNPGWEPVCDFLGQPVPACPFPDKSNRTETIHTFSRSNRIGWMVWESLFPEFIHNIEREDHKRVVRRITKQ